MHVFNKMSDAALRKVLLDYESYRETGFIPDDGLLADARDQYCAKYEANSFINLQVDLLYEVARRWAIIYDKGVLS